MKTSAARRLPEPEPVVGGVELPTAVFERIVADMMKRNGAAYKNIAEAEATWTS